MAIKEYLKIDLKKPELEGEQLSIFTKKDKFKKELELCYSRLESIEICNSNSKTRDSLILVDHLIVDIVNLVLNFQDSDPINKLSEIEQNIPNFPEELQPKAKELLTIFSLEISDDEKSEKLESSLGDFLFSTEKYYKKTTKQPHFITPIDEYKKKIKIQSLLFLIVFAIFSTSVFKLYKIFEAKTYKLKNDIVQVYYFPKNENLGKPLEENSIKAEISPSIEWKTILLPFPSPTDVGKIRIDPVNQNRAKLQIKEIQYLDKDKKVIAGRDFKITQNNLVENMDQIFEVRMVKIDSKAKSEYIQAETIDDNPFFYLDIGNFSNVSYIQITMRYIEKYKQF
ncbi:MAG: hypothetical protein H7A23_13535 [Leptospiraceae bacterium]|nr:hypothetical protein [Leptospiraceae bacterium]MCP5495573.1 hypothetical protein [Leptospiraceae bacterium]